MITSSVMYWITRLDGLALMAYIFTTISFVVTAMFVVSLVYSYIDFDDRETKKRKAKFALSSLSIFAFLFLVGVLIPTTKEMAAVLVIPKIANSETVGEQWTEISELAKEWINELKPKKKEGEIK